MGETGKSRGDGRTRDQEAFQVDHPTFANRSGAAGCETALQAQPLLVPSLAVGKPGATGTSTSTSTSTRSAQNPRLRANREHDRVDPTSHREDGHDRLGCQAGARARSEDRGEGTVPIGDGRRGAKAKKKLGMCQRARCASETRVASVFFFFLFSVLFFRFSFFGFPPAVFLFLFFSFLFLAPFFLFFYFSFCRFFFFPLPLSGWELRVRE